MVSNAIIEYSRRTPFARVFVFYSLGIGAGYYLKVSSQVVYSLFAFLIAFLILTFLLNVFVKGWFKLSFPYAFPFLLSLTGLLAISFQLPSCEKNYVNRRNAAAFVGVITDEPVFKNNTWRFPIDISAGFANDSSFDVSGKVIVTIEQDTSTPTHWAYGDRIVFRNKLSEIAEAYNPHQFSYKRYCASKNIYYQAYLKPDEMLSLESKQGNFVIQTALTLRQQLMQKFQRFVKSQETLNLCVALIFGYRGSFDTETLRTFSDTGTIHVLSVSGMHVGIVFFLLNALCYFLDRFKYGKSMQFLFIFSAIWCYVVLTGLSPSIFRAGLMISFLLVANWSGRSYANLNSLFAAACCQLFFSPFTLFDVGFQLSYCAVYGLFVCYPLLLKSYAIKNSWLYKLYQFICLSISAQLFTMPLALYYFHQFPSYFILGNSVVAIPTTLLLYLGIILALLPYAALNTILGQALEWISSFMLAGLETVQHLPNATVTGIHLSFVQMLLLSGSIFAFIWALQMRWKYGLWASLLFFVLFTVIGLRKKLEIDSYQGIKIYNVQREVAIAVIDRGDVSLFTTLDSLKHPRLLNAVWPDLSNYKVVDHIRFEKINAEKGRNFTIKTVMGNIAIVDRFLSDEVIESADWILWRQLGSNDTLQVSRLHGDQLVILDGSSFLNNILSIVEKTKSLAVPCYVLKDNFAYVWEKPD